MFGIETTETVLQDAAKTGRLYAGDNGRGGTVFVVGGAPKGFDPVGVEQYEVLAAETAEAEDKIAAADDKVGGDRRKRVKKAVDAAYGEYVSSGGKLSPEDWALAFSAAATPSKGNNGNQGKN